MKARVTRGGWSRPRTEKATLLAVLVTGLVFIGVVALAVATQPTSPGAAPGESSNQAFGPLPSLAPPTAVAPCTRTVAGFTAAAVHAARDAAGSGTVCFPAGTYSGNVTASVAGQTWRLDPNAMLTGVIQVTGRGVTISGGRSQRGTGDAWSAGVEVNADDVTVERMRFVSGGIGVATYGRDRTTVRRRLRHMGRWPRRRRRRVRGQHRRPDPGLPR
jgi:hypothetical protein